MAPLHNITILGGGLTGLTTAYRLSRVLATLPPLPQGDHEQHKGAHRDTKVTLLEKSNRIGGWVHSSPWIVKVPQKGESEPKEVEIMLEAGPRSIRPKGSVGAAYMLKLVSLLPYTSHSNLTFPRSKTLLSRTISFRSHSTTRQRETVSFSLAPQTNSSVSPQDSVISLVCRRADLRSPLQKEFPSPEQT
jgi:hypothetical protein